MLLMPQPAFDCLEDVLVQAKEHRRVLYMSPQGQPLTAQTAKRLSDYEELIVLCGHYEGIDQRVLDTFVDEEISLGDFILTGGEIAAMAVVDAVARFVPGVLGMRTAFPMACWNIRSIPGPANFAVCACRRSC